MTGTADAPRKPSLQPRIWLLVTSVGVGTGAALVVGPQPDREYPTGALWGWESVLVGGVVQLVLGWLAMRGGEDPDSIDSAGTLKSDEALLQRVLDTMDEGESCGV